MDKNGNMWICVYKDTTPFDDGGVDNLIDLEVPESVVRKYMKENKLDDGWLETYTTDQTMDFYEFAKNDIIDMQPVGY